MLLWLLDALLDACTRCLRCCGCWARLYVFHWRCVGVALALLVVAVVVTRVVFVVVVAVDFVVIGAQRRVALALRWRCWLLLLVVVAVVVVGCCCC